MAAQRSINTRGGAGLTPQVPRAQALVHKGGHKGKTTDHNTTVASSYKQYNNPLCLAPHIGRHGCRVDSTRL